MKTVTTVQLPPTRRCAWRVATYVTVRPGIGSLEIRTATARGQPESILRYLVNEERGSGGFRAFRLKRPGSDLIVYRTQILVHKRSAVEDRCNCGLGKLGHWCRHMQALRQLIEEDILPEPT